MFINQNELTYSIESIFLNLNFNIIFGDLIKLKI